MLISNRDRVDLAASTVRVFGASFVFSLGVSFGAVGFLLEFGYQGVGRPLCSAFLVVLFLIFRFPTFVLRPFLPVMIDET